MYHGFCFVGEYLSIYAHARPSARPPIDMTGNCFGWGEGEKGGNPNVFLNNDPMQNFQTLRQRLLVFYSERSERKKERKNDAEYKGLIIGSLVHALRTEEWWTQRYSNISKFMLDNLIFQVAHGLTC
jgi:hypothetical protein